jgi:hypothetical protein
MERVSMSQPAAEQGDDQIARERAATQVSDVLLNLEHTLARARKGHKIVAKDGVDVNAELALTDLIRELDKLRKRFTQDTYYASDSRLI